MIEMQQFVITQIYDNVVVNLLLWSSCFSVMCCCHGNSIKKC